MMTGFDRERAWVRAIVSVLAFTLACPVGVGRVLAQEAGAEGSQNAKRRLAIVVVPERRKDATGALLLKGLLRGMADRLEAVGITRGLTSPPESPEDADRVRDAVERGRKALNAGDWTQAVGLFTDAEKRLYKSYPLLDRATVARVYKGLGVALANTNQLEKAAMAVRRSLTLYPNQQEASYAFNLETRNLFRRAKSDLENAPNGSLKIETTPGGAEVYVDFEFRGFSPVTVEGLFEGDHLVVAYLEGYHPDSVFANVRGGEREEVRLAFMEGPNFKTLRRTIRKAKTILRRRKGSVNEDLAQGLRQLCGATDLVFLVVRDSRTRFRVRGVLAGQKGVTQVDRVLAKDRTLVASALDLVRKVVGVEVPAQSELTPLDEPVGSAAVPVAESAAAAPAVGKELIIDPNSPIFRQRKKKEEFNVLKQWWFWTAVGVVVGGATALGVVLARSKGGGKEAVGRMTIDLHGIQ